MPSTPSPIGRNVATYRKLAGISAQDLADNAQHGLTRSIIANLENGRKDDLSVRQLLSIAATLRVPPVALLADLTEPAAPAWFQPGFQIPLPDPDQPLPRNSIHDADLREYDLASWIAGLFSLPSSAGNAATKRALEILDVLGVYSAAFHGFSSSVSWLINARESKANQAELDNLTGDADYDDTVIGEATTQVQFAYDTLIGAIDHAQRTGIKIEHTRKMAERTMRALHVTPLPPMPEFPSSF